MPALKNATTSRTFVTKLLLLGVGLFALMVLIVAPAPAPASAQTLPPDHTALAAPESLGLIAFEARQKKKFVTVSWETGSETTLVGFNVWRRTGKGELKRLNTEMLPTVSPGEIIGNTYGLRDKNVSVGKVYFYQLEIISAEGYSAWTEEVRVKLK